MPKNPNGFYFVPEWIATLPGSYVCNKREWKTEARERGRGEGTGDMVERESEEGETERKGEGMEGERRYEWLEGK
jgi:hypothetical protein